MPGHRWRRLEHRGCARHACRTPQGADYRRTRSSSNPQGDAHFAALITAQFAPSRPANVLPFNQTLAVARFRCNIQETKGVACLSEESGKGFTFSADGFNLQYSEVPLDTP